MDVKQIHETLSRLVAPLETKLPPEETPDVWFDDLLKAKLKAINEDQGDQTDIRWRYVEVCLSKLRELSSKMSEKTEEASDLDLLLSVSQQKVISSVAQLIVGMGVVPNLLPGVGLPIEKRSKFAEIFRTRNRVRVDEMYKRLVSVITNLFEILSQNKQISSLIVTKNFGDILAALVQLSYAPLKKPSSSSSSSSREESPTTTDDFVMTEDFYQNVLRDQEYFRNKLSVFIEKVYQPLAIKYLLVIQSGSKNNWLRKVCGNLLSERLVRNPHGVLNIIRGVLDIGSEDSTGDPRKKYQVIAGVLANPPSDYRDMEEYYKIVSPQILGILNSKDESPEKCYHMIACACVRSMAERSLILSRRYILGPLMETLYKLTRFEKERETETEVTEEMLEKCIVDLHMIFVIGNDPSIMFLNHLEPVIAVLLELHCAITFGVSHLRRQVQEILIRYLKHSNMSHSLGILRAFAFRDFSEFPRVLKVREYLKFVPGDSGGTKVDLSETERNFYVQDDEKSIAIIDLIADVSKELTVEFFMSLVRDLTEIMSQGSDDLMEPDLENATTEAKLLKLEIDIDNTMNRLRKNLMIIRLLGLMSEDDKLQEDISQNSQKMIGFIALTLERGAILCSKRQEKRKEGRAEDEDNEFGVMEIQSLTMALSILSVRVTQPELRLSDWDELKQTLDSLKVLEDQYPDERVRKMSRQLRRLIATHGAVMEHSASIREKAEKITDASVRLGQLAEEVRKLRKEEEDESNDENKTPYERALYDLTDPLLPVQGHGLIQLTRLIEEKDQESLDHLDKVVKIFQENLEDEDTYIYLSAINGLVAAAAVTDGSKSEAIIELLTREFSMLDDRKYFKADKAMEIRTKVGEALVRITSLLGNMTAKYKTLLLNAFLGQVHHPDELIRASSFSNLGQVCKNLKFALGNIIQEILMCLDQAVKFDKSLEVRRAAVLVLTLLLQGLGIDSFSVLKEVLKDIYRSLKSLQRTEKDETLLIHVGLALDEIDKIVRQFLVPDQGLQKTIYVLDPPPDPF